MGILRLLLAISVVINHSAPVFGFSLVGGQIAVQAFYIISGFYMTMILTEKYVGKNGSYKLFITNRFLRLYPIYWVVLLLSIGFAFFRSDAAEGNYFGTLHFYASHLHEMNVLSGMFLLFTNAFLFLQDTVMFLGLDTTSGYLFFTKNFHDTDPMLFQFLFVPQAWTVGVEIAFYLIAPFLVRRKLKYIVLFILCSLALRLFLYYGLDLKNDPWTYRFFPTELLFFMLGVLAYHIYRRFKDQALDAGRLKLIWSSIIGLTLLFGFWEIPGKEIAYIVVFFISLPFVFMLTKKWKFDTLIGELSYPVYISHIFLFACMNELKIPAPGGKGFTLILISIAFSFLLNELVAKRIERFRQKRLSRS